MSTPQPIAAGAIGILLDGVVGALADRGHLTPEQRQTRAEEVWALVDTFGPRDPLQVMLIGQALLFHELVADSAQDVLRGMADTLKLRTRSNVNALNRSLHQNLGMFLRLRDQAITAEQEAAEKRHPAPAVVAEEIPTPPPPTEEVSGLDEPGTTWVIETPAPAAGEADECVSNSLARPDDAAALPSIDRRHRSGARPLFEPAARGAERSRAAELLETS